MTRSRPFNALRLLALVLATAVATGPASAATLPPALVESLEADRGRASTQLDARRTELGERATTQREAAAVHARLQDRADVLTMVATLVGSDLPAGIQRQLDGALEESERSLEAADDDLDSATTATSQAQARMLDADRRLRAIQRASATENERDTTLGSWRFGSGGPGVSADSIDRYLQSKGSPLAGEGAAFLEAGVEHEVDPRLVVAIAGAESYFGVTTCASFNAWGWGCPTSPFTFTSWAHAIDTVTLGLREGYLDDGRTTVGTIHLRYAPPNAANDPTGLNYAWADNVARFLVEQGGDPQSVAGVLGPSR